MFPELTLFAFVVLFSLHLEDACPRGGERRTDRRASREQDGKQDNRHCHHAGHSLSHEETWRHRAGTEAWGETPGPPSAENAVFRGLGPPWPLRVRDCPGVTAAFVLFLAAGRGY